MNLDWDDDDVGRDDDDCGHEDADLDILEGRFQCSCGYRWWASEVDVLREIEHQRAYAEYEERENRRQWWRDIWALVKSMLPHRRPEMPVDDDQIPF